MNTAILEKEERLSGREAAGIVWKLAWPAVALNSLQSVNALLDRFFLGQVPQSHLTAYGGSINVIFLFFSIAMMLGTAATALVSRMYGAGERKEMRTAARHCVSLAIYLGLSLVALAIPAGFLGAKAFVPPNDTEAARLMALYVAIIATSLPAMNVIQALAGSLRGIGDTKSPMVLSGIQIVLHVILNYVFILPPKMLGPIMMPGLDMGLLGAGWALSISAWMSAIAYLWWARRRPLVIRFRFPWPGLDWAKRILRIAVPSGALSILRVTSLMGFTAILARVPMGAAAVAALPVGFAIESLAFMPSFGLSVSAAALVGQSLGMKKPDRASRLGWTAAHHAAVVSTIVAILLYIFADPLAHLILPSAEQADVAAISADFLRWISLTEVFFAYAMVLIGAMQGAGDTVRPMWLTFWCQWVVRVPLAGVLALAFGLGATGCWIAMSSTQLLQGIVALVMWKQGRWKTAKV